MALRPCTRGRDRSRPYSVSRCLFRVRVGGLRGGTPFRREFIRRLLAWRGEPSAKRGRRAVARILLVEDARELAQVIVRELQAAGYETLHAADGISALEL